MRSLWLAKGTIIISMQRRMPERKLRKPGLSKPWFLLFFQKGYAIIEQSGKIVKSDLEFTSNKAILDVIERIVTPLGRRIDESSPMVDASKTPKMQKQTPAAMPMENRF